MVWAGVVLIVTNFWLFGAGVVVLIVGLMGAKGDEQIRVGEMVYPLSQVADIVFQIKGYDGMIDEQGYASTRVAGSPGMGILNSGTRRSNGNFT